MFSYGKPWSRNLRRRFVNKRQFSFVIALGSLVAGPQWAGGQALTPNNAFISAYNALVQNNAGVAATRENAFSILTNGVVNHEFADKIDTWNSDNNGNVLDFVGLQYSTPYRFDTITVELANQFGDGGDWEALPKVYILKNPTLTGDSVEPNLSPNWVEVTGHTETTGHVFNPIVVPGPGGRFELDLSSIPAAQRTGWGWAVGGVDGNQNASNIFHFVSLSEVFATGVPAAAPVAPQPATPTPVNVIANAYNSIGLNNDGLAGPWRGQAFKALTNNFLDRNGTLGQDGLDTFQGDATGTLTDFVGLQYSSIYRFDTLTVELGNQFGDGGDWEETPKIYILKNPVDTNTTRPETDPDNWVEITGATETTGHVFSSLVTPGAGGTINFDLSAIPASQRTGWGWAIGGVDGNQNASGVINFISVTELDATGALVPGPYVLKLEVNTTTGATRIVNGTPFAVPMDFYEVTSASGSLNPAAWNSFETPAGNPAGFPSGTGSGNGWEEMGNLGPTIVAEGYLQGTSTLAVSGSATLGNLFAAGGSQDLAFRYRTSGGAFIDATVEYISGGFLPADFNQDNVVNGADLATWKTAYGTTALGDANADGKTDGADFLIWQRQYGMTSSVAANGAVPEPHSCVLLLAAAMGLASVRGRKVE